MARPGSSVAVTLSRGPRERPVPDVTGLTHGQASVALSRAGYRSEVVWVDAEADVGLVVSTRPAPGTPLELPGSVRLLVSAGPREAPVPELSGSSVAEARAALERLGLKLGTVTQDSTSLAAAGTVMSQEPPPGTVAARGTEVSVVVAVGVPQPVETVDTTEVPADSFWIGL
jgi:serine/threonine-protein kinase